MKSTIEIYIKSDHKQFVVKWRCATLPKSASAKK